MLKVISLYIYIYINKNPFRILSISLNSDFKISLKKHIFAYSSNSPNRCRDKQSFGADAGCNLPNRFLLRTVSVNGITGPAPENRDGNPLSVFARQRWSRGERRDLRLVFQTAKLMTV